jgi:hypothetical protein
LAALQLHNQGKTVAGTSWANHVSDWEHVKVKLDGIDFANPQNEGVVGVMYDHHGDQDNIKPGDGDTEQRGDLLGLVARLESGPEGPFRPGEYAPPTPVT